MDVDKINKNMIDFMERDLKMIKTTLMKYDFDDPKEFATYRKLRHHVDRMLEHLEVRKQNLSLQ